MYIHIVRLRCKIVRKFNLYDKNFLLYNIVVRIDLGVIYLDIWRQV